MGAKREEEDMLITCQITFFNMLSLALGSLSLPKKKSLLVALLHCLFSWIPKQTNIDFLLLLSWFNSEQSLALAHTLAVTIKQEGSVNLLKAFLDSVAAMGRLTQGHFGWMLWLQGRTLNKQEALAHYNQTNTAVIRNSWKEDGWRECCKHTNWASVLFGAHSQ